VIKGCYQDSGVDGSGALDAGVKPKPDRDVPRKDAAARLDSKPPPDLAPDKTQSVDQRLPADQKIVTSDSRAADARPARDVGQTDAWENDAGAKQDAQPGLDAGANSDAVASGDANTGSDANAGSDLQQADSGRADSGPMSDSGATERDNGVRQKSSGGRKLVGGCAITASGDANWPTLLLALLALVARRRRS
jgi:MYXO-CTERM domain-containing protein